MTDSSALPTPLNLEGSSSRASISPFGAQVLEWTVDSDTPVIWMSPLAAHDGVRTPRGGIPICLPWFGAHLSDPEAPKHGFARTAMWTQISPDPADKDIVHGESDSTYAEFALAHSPSQNSSQSDQPVQPGADGYFPFSFEANLSIDVTDSLMLRLTVTNTDTRPFTFQEAFHTYVAVGDIKDVTIEGLDGAFYDDKSLARDHSRKQIGEVTFVRYTDRIYHSDANVQIRDPRFRRIVSIEKSGSANTIVWNPWSDTVGQFDDLESRAWQEFVCVESGNVADEAIELEPGQSHTMTVSIYVDSME
ncbi:MAG: D-hexose-6-phosphate mutarotase [Actinomyces sp.]|nr:D-hexose-6-phosphate mutarotase [Actinomyces sp.]